MIEKRFISPFSGAMGLDLGLEEAGFSTALCVENAEEAIATIKLNRPHLPVLRDIRSTDGTEIRELSGFGDKAIPLVVGGPPCQAFSVFGNREGINDPRGQLIFDFVRLIGDLTPDVFVMENVRGLLSMPIANSRHLEDEGADASEITRHGSLLRLIIGDFESLGYRVDCFVVNAVNYGAPQIRERLICIGNRHNLLSNFPEPTFSNRPEDCLPPFRTLGDAIGDGFIDPCPEKMEFSERKLKYLAMVPPGGNWRSLSLDIQKESMGKSWYLKGGRSAYWRKLSFAFPSPTVVTMPNHAGTSMCHPTELRAITVGEAAAIQEFPKTWRFVGNATAKFRQVGNAVPVRLGRVAGEVVNKLLDSLQSEREGSKKLVPSRVVHVRPHIRTRTFWKNGTTYAGDTSYYAESTQQDLFSVTDS
jgi:DNA (cytosine-5)-methyltransferase 1